MGMRSGESVYFYELHEGDDDVFTDVLLMHDNEYDEGEFLELVLDARGAVIERYEEDTLSEAIARELRERHGFLVVNDELLRVAVNVSVNDGETTVVDVDVHTRTDPGMEGADTDFRSLVLDIEDEDLRWGID